MNTCKDILTSYEYMYELSRTREEYDYEKSINSEVLKCYV